jgi:hypothetical protein
MRIEKLRIYPYTYTYAYVETDVNIRINIQVYAHINIQGDKKVSVHLMITVQKHAKLL